jgi:hypothetical protein
MCNSFIHDGVAKSPLYGVTAIFQDLDLPDSPLKKHQALEDEIFA